MWDYTGWGNYNSLQTGLTRRFDKGFMVSAFYVWSRALTVNNDDFTAGLPSTDKDAIKRLDYSYASYDRPNNFVLNFIYQVPKFASGALGAIANDWQISGVYRWTSGLPYRVAYSIPGIGNANLSGTDNPAARVVVTCHPGKGYTGGPYRMISSTSANHSAPAERAFGAATSCIAPTTSRRGESSPTARCARSSSCNINRGTPAGCASPKRSASRSTPGKT